MKLAAVLVPLLAVAAPALAQDHSAHAGHAMPAPAPAAPAAAAKLTIDSPIEALMANPAAKAAVEAQMPGVEGHPAYGQFKTMSLKQVQPFSQGMITDDMLAKIAAALADLK